MSNTDWRVVTNFLLDLFDEGFNPGILQPDELSTKLTKQCFANIDLENETTVYAAVTGAMAPAQVVFNAYKEGEYEKQEAVYVIASFRGLLTMLRPYLPVEEFEKFFISDDEELSNMPPL